MGSRKIGKFVRLNASRSGIGASVGVKGLRISIGSRGIRTHMTVPGTGYTKTSTLVSFKKMLKNKKKTKKAQAKKQNQQLSTSKTEVIEPTQQGETSVVQDELVLNLVKTRPANRLTNEGKADRLINKGIDAFNQEMHTEAAGFFEEALTLTPEDKELVLYLAIIHYLYLEDYNQAIEYFDQLDEAMYNEDMKLAIADCLYELGDFEYAKTVLESFQFPDDEEMERLTLLGRCYMAQDMDMIALEVLKKAVGRKSKLTERLMAAKYSLGELYLKLRDYEQAKKHLMPVYLEDSSYEEIGRLVEALALNAGEA